MLVVNQHLQLSQPTNVYEYPYRHVPTDVLMELRDQLDAINEKVTDLFAHDLDAIPPDLAGVNSAGMAIEIELAWRELDEANSGTRFPEGGMKQ